MNIAGRESLVALGNESAATRIVLVSDVSRSAKLKIKSHGVPLNFQKYWAGAILAFACGMVLIGGWMAAQIEAGVVDNAAAAAAHHIDTLMSRHLQELASGSDISEEHKRALDALLSSDAMRKQIVALRIWKENVVAYNDPKNDIGKTLQPTTALARAQNGEVVGQPGHLTNGHGPGAVSSGLPVLELYAPVRKHGSNRIIAIAEVYEIAPALTELWRVKPLAWLLMGATSLAIVALSYRIVDKGSRTIARQRIPLAQRAAEFSSGLVNSQDAYKRVDQANARMSESDERFLRGIRADLHDGPLQLLGLALMRLDEARNVVTDGQFESTENADQISLIRCLLTEAVRDIRHISAGLGPPDVDDVSLREALQMAAQSHQRRTGTRVQCEFNGPDRHVAFPLKVCIYRFVQEALSNAYRHSDGRGQAVVASCNGAKIGVNVIDEGPGLAATTGTNGGGKGLSGLCDRIESLGGAFEVCSKSGKGTRLTARFDTSAGGDRPEHSPLH